jgi:hypothetical protein
MGVFLSISFNATLCFRCTLARLNSPRRSRGLRLLWVFLPGVVWELSLESFFRSNLNSKGLQQNQNLPGRYLSSKLASEGMHSLAWGFDSQEPVAAVFGSTRTQEAKFGRVSEQATLGFLDANRLPSSIRPAQSRFQENTYHQIPTKRHRKVCLRKWKEVLDFCYSVFTFCWF